MNILKIEPTPNPNTMKVVLDEHKEDMKSSTHTEVSDDNPEFINRVDEIITFDQLSLEAITKIIDIELKGLYDRIESIGYKLVIEDKAK